MDAAARDQYEAQGLLKTAQDSAAIKFECIVDAHASRVHFAVDRLTT